MPDNLESIVQRMIDAGEPEDAIAGVIREFPAQAFASRGQPRWTPGTSEDPRADQSGFLHGLNEQLRPAARPWEADSPIGVVGNLLQSVVPSAAMPTLAMHAIPKAQAGVRAAGTPVAAAGRFLEKAGPDMLSLAGLKKAGLHTTGRILQRTGRMMGGAPEGRLVPRGGRPGGPAGPIPSGLDDAVRGAFDDLMRADMPSATDLAPSPSITSAGREGEFFSSGRPATGGRGAALPEISPPASQAPRPATTATGSVVPPTPRPDLVAVGDEAAFNATRPQPPQPTPALSVDEVVAQRFNAVEPQREIARAERLATSHAPSAPAIEPLPPSRSSGPRSPVAPELTPRDLEVLGIDPATGKNPQGMRILKLKGTTPDAKQRILQSRANRRGQYQADAEILADLRHMQEREP